MNPDTISTSIPPGSTLELAPSETRSEVPYFTRFLGGLGLFLFVVGGASALAASGFFGTVTDPVSGMTQSRGLFSLGTSYLITLLGTLGMLIHAVSDDDLEIRRLYGAFAGVLLIAAVVVTLIPNPRTEFFKFNNLMPWGSLLALLGLLFSVPFLRNESDERFRSIASRVLLGFALVLISVAFLSGLLKPDFLVGSGLALGLLGLGFLMAYLNHEDTSDGWPYLIAVGLGVIGTIILAYSLSRAIVPTLLYEGPAALKLPTQQYDKWKVSARVLLILASLGVVVWAFLGRMAPWLRGVLAVLGLAVAAVFSVASFTAPWTNPPSNYLVPNGLIYASLGVIYLSVSLSIVSDLSLIVLFRRELSAFFYSPIAYLVLFASGFASALGYAIFLVSLALFRDQPTATPEPVLSNYMSMGIIGAFIVVFLVPAITMRLFSEEQRTGTLEVLLTAPVNEPVIVVSKFLAAWVFYMLTWVPAGLYLIGLQVASGPEGSFDYRPVLTFYLCAGCTGAAFVAVGLFFSSLTNNQIVAAVLTFAVMMFLLLSTVFRRVTELPEGLSSVLDRFDFLRLWSEAVSGQLAVQVVIFQLSIAAFWLFLTTKVLEARKWS